MENWAKGIGIACALCAALFFWVIAILFEYLSPRSIAATLIITAIGLAFFVGGLILYRKAIHSIGRGTAFLGVLSWLAFFLVFLPNFLMSLLLSGFQFLNLLLWVFAFTFASPYYGIPAGLFGEELFLMETVISPKGIAGLLLSALFWAAVVILTVFVLHIIAVWWGDKKRGIQ
jgi:hypothetical protein